MTSTFTKGTRLGDCELLVRIGRGGMATVWVAKKHGATPADDRLVAVKVMHADLAEESRFVEMFRAEVSLARAIDHPNVVEVHGVGEHAGVMYMTMEWLEGDSLHTIIAEAGKRRAIPPEMAVKIIAEAAAGLHAAHELRDPDGSLLGVVHRDVSPQNILIATDGVVKLVDFGVAKAVGHLSEGTRAGQLKGKFGYMAPEQATGRPVDRRADVFALGVVLYELTTNQRLFRGENEVETLHKVVSGEIAPPTRLDPGYPPALERIVLRALERDVDRRYQTAAELESDLRGYLRAEQIVVPGSGIAGLLKRVLSTRIEQRRRVIRKAVKSLGASGDVEPDLIPVEPAFTPTGSNPLDIPSVTGMSQLTSMSQVASLERGRARAPRLALRRLVRKAGGRGPFIGYCVGVFGLVAGALLALFGGREEPPPPAPASTSLTPVRVEARSARPEASDVSSGESGKGKIQLEDIDGKVSLDELEAGEGERSPKPAPKDDRPTKNE